MRVAVIGGGIVGVSLGYFLSRAGHSVVLYEASDQIGGLAGTIRLGDVEIDRFYHTILSSDTHMQELAAELGIADRLRFRATGSAFFHEGRLYPMTTLRDFMAFPLLRAIDRARLGLTILAAYFHRDWHRLEEISVEEWLTRWGGRRAFHHLWRPMLRAKFDGRFEDLPATYIWARLIRTRSTRSGVSQREMAGYLVGGHMTLIRAMAQAIEAAGGEIRLRSPVQEVVVSNRRVAGVRVDGITEPCEAAAITLHPPLVPRLLPGIEEPWVEDLRSWRYLGVGRNRGGPTGADQTGHQPQVVQDGAQDFHLGAPEAADAQSGGIFRYTEPRADRPGHDLGYRHITIRFNGHRLYDLTPIGAEQRRIGADR